MAEIDTDEVLEVTQSAAARVRALADRERRPDPILRLRIVAGGCDGFSYRLSLESEVTEDDLVIERHGVRILVDPRSIPLVRGSTLDFSDALLGGGLKVRNPNASHECACGESFSV